VVWGSNNLTGMSMVIGQNVVWGSTSNVASPEAIQQLIMGDPQ
jgi:hypothetical protein